MIDIFERQEEISHLVSARIATELGLLEHKRAVRQSRKNLGAWELYQLGSIHACGVIGIYGSAADVQADLGEADRGPSPTALGNAGSAAAPPRSRSSSWTAVLLASSPASKPRNEADPQIGTSEPRRIGPAR